MKTKSILNVLLVVIMAIAVMNVRAQVNRPDDPNKPIPPSEVLPTAGHLTTLDNENNALTGTADGDMDYYLYNSDAIHPIEFNIFITETPVVSAQLSILAWDVDWAGQPPTYIGELDKVYVNGNYVGDLSGVNDTWSTTVMNINPAFIVPAGKNLIQIYVDNRNEGWAVEVDWGQLVINGSVGNATYRYVNTNGTYFCSGQCVLVTSEVDANPSMNVRTEDYLVDPSNNSVAQVNHTFLATSGNEPVVSSLCLPANPTPGVWSVKTLVFDAATNVQQDVRIIPITVTENCNTIPTLTEWGLILLGLALLATGTIFLIRRRS